MAAPSHVRRVGDLGAARLTERKLVVLNLTAEQRRLELAEQAAMALSNALNREREAVVGALILRPNEGVVLDTGDTRNS